MLAHLWLGARNARDTGVKVTRRRIASLEHNVGTLQTLFYSAGSLIPRRCRQVAQNMEKMCSTACCRRRSHVGLIID